MFGNVLGTWGCSYGVPHLLSQHLKFTTPSQPKELNCVPPLAMEVKVVFI